MNAQNKGKLTNTSEKNIQFFLSSLLDRKNSCERNLSFNNKNQYRKKDSGMSWKDVSFTKRQLQCLICFALNLNHQQASEKISISRQNYRAHINIVRKRLGFNSSQLMRHDLVNSKFGKSLMIIDPIDLVP